MPGLPSLLGALGGVGVGFALISFVIAVASAETGSRADLSWVGANLVIGIVLLVTAAAMNVDALRERMSSGEARRAGKYGTSAVLSTVLGIALLGMLGFLSTRYHHRFDWSEQKVYTLSDQSQKVLEGLDQDVAVTALVSAVDQAPVRELLERAVGSRARIEYLSFTPPVRLTAVPDFEQCVVGYTTDVPHLSNWGTPLLLGPGSIHDAHTARERIAKAELERGVELYLRLGRTLLAEAAPARRGKTAGARP